MFPWRKPRRHFLPFLWLLFFVIACLSSTQTDGQIVSFNQIGQSEGLRNGNVRAIARDHQGFMWFGTEDGLHRFDGYSMKVYRKDESDSTSISSNYILCLYEDSKKNLWVGTLGGGLCLYNREKDNFVRYSNTDGKKNSKIDDAIRVIYETSNHELFIGSAQLLHTNLNNGSNPITFQSINLKIDASMGAGFRIVDVKELSDTLLVVAIHNLGLYLYNVKTNRFYEHNISRIEKYVQAVYVDKVRKLIWLGTWKNGLLVCDYTGSTYRRIQTGNDMHTLRNNYVPKLAADSAGNIWIGTDHGLSMISYRCDPMKEPIVYTYLPDQQNHSSIQGSIIKAVYVDPSDKLWVGSYYNGISVYDKRSNHFGSITLTTEMDLQKANLPSVTALVEDSDHNLWFGTDGSGLYFSSDSTRQNPPSFNRITSCPGIDKIKAMKLDAKKNLWIGTWGHGLIVFNTRTRECRNFNSFGFDAPIGTEITALEIDRADNIWIGTFDNGVFRFNQKKNNIDHLHPTAKSSNFIDRINVLQYGGNNDLWIGREVGGLSHTVIDGNNYQTIESKYINSSTTVTAVYFDDNGQLWVGCPSNGLVNIDLKNKSSVLYTEQDGLANSMIYSILEDNMDRLWISTDAGLSLFNKQSKKFINFGVANGILSNQFNKSSSLKADDGFLFFGNIRGVNYIKPEDISLGSRSSQVAFTKLLVNNREQLVDKPGSVLRSNVSVTRNIHLEHDQNSFSVEVAALNFDFSVQPEYYYKLEGFNDSWQYGGARQQIQYTNLEPSSYLLKVSTSPDAEEAAMAIMEIVIHPAWWQTTFFRIFVFVALVSFAFAVHRFRIRYLLQQRSYLEAQVSLRTQSLNQTNELLTSKLGEINLINDVLKQHQEEILAKNNEIKGQYEELTLQNEQIADQHNKLFRAQQQLQEINANLEKTVDERTQTLQQTIDDLNKIVFELDRFVYSASHDLSAPLKSILGLVQIINLETDRDRTLEYVGLIHESVQKLETVIRSMVEYARNAHAQVTTEKFYLGRIVDEVFRELAFLPGTCQLKFENQVPEDLEINNDPSRMKVILHNLIGNGIKYMDKTKEYNFIRVEACKNGSKTFVKVIDNGIGIRPEFLDKIFNMYFRGTETSKGSGLGLFIVKETLHKIGGSITVQSDIGAGTKFEVTVPEEMKDDSVRKSDV